MNTQDRIPEQHYGGECQHVIWLFYDNVCSEKNRVFKPKVAWHLVNNDDIDKYHAAMDDELNTIDICYNSVECEDYFCRNPEQICNLDSLCNALIDICFKASDRTFPMRSHPSGRLPMWNERVRPLRATSLLWHSLRKSAGEITGA